MGKESDSAIACTPGMPPSSAEKKAILHVSYYAMHFKHI
jgi:hypothetical protein